MHEQCPYEIHERNIKSIIECANIYKGSSSKKKTDFV